MRLTVLFNLVAPGVRDWVESTVIEVKTEGEDVRQANQLNEGIKNELSSRSVFDVGYKTRYVIVQHMA
jgi:hypothetical protein